MRHEAGCACERCRPSSLSDSILTGVLTLAGVAFAIMSGSTVAVAAVILVLIAVVARKLLHPMLGMPGRKREE